MSWILIVFTSKTPHESLAITLRILCEFAYGVYAISAKLE